MYSAILVKISNLAPHTNADRLQLTQIYGNTVIVGMDQKVGDVGLFFPVGSQLSVELCATNNLLALRDEKGIKIGGGYLEANRAIKATKLRGEKSEGLWLPISCLDYIVDPGSRSVIQSLSEGEAFEDILDNHICKRYYARTNVRSTPFVNKKGTPKKDYIQLKRHYDTDNIKYKLNELQVGDVLEVSLKMHGSSHRIGRVKHFEYISQERKPKTFVEKVQGLFGKKFYEDVSDYSWRNVSASRNNTLDYNLENWGECNKFRYKTHQLVAPHLEKGIAIYGEIVGWENDFTPIMNRHYLDKIQDKAIKKLYPENIVYTYGQNIGENAFYIYRIVFTNEDGFSQEFSSKQIKDFCDARGLEVVPILGKIEVISNDANGVMIKDFTSGESKNIFSYLEKYDKPDPKGVHHPTEGVCLRNTRNDKIYKHKTYTFSVLEGIATEIEEDKEESA